MFTLFLHNILALVAGLCLLAAQASALPRSSVLHASRDVNTPQYFQNVVYWGQDYHKNADRDLADYCTPDAGIDVLVLSFLFEANDTTNILYGQMGNCTIAADGTAQGCDELGDAIQHCQAANKTILLSIGGATANIAIESNEQATSMAHSVWNMFGNPKVKTAPRPFNDNYVNGFDFDIEAFTTSNQYYPTMISELQQLFKEDALDAPATYYISGAPQCPRAEKYAYMDTIINSTAFDYLFVQFYNNPGNCQLPSLPGKDLFNYDDWISYTAETPSNGSKIFIGVPASSDAGVGYIDSTELGIAIDNYSHEPRFGGVMMWAAGYSDQNILNNGTYAQRVRKILDDVQAVQSEGPSAVSSSMVLSTALSTAAVSISTVSSSTVSSSTVSSSAVSSATVPSSTVSASPTTTSSAAHQPQQSGLASNCNNFYDVQPGDSCYSIEQKYGISAAQFSSWNPSIDSLCTDLWSGYYVCVGVPGTTASDPTPSSFTSTDFPLSSPTFSLPPDIAPPLPSTMLTSTIDPTGTSVSSAALTAEPLSTSASSTSVPISALLSEMLSEVSAALASSAHVSTSSSSSVSSSSRATAFTAVSLPSTTGIASSPTSTLPVASPSATSSGSTSTASVLAPGALCEGRDPSDPYLGPSAASCPEGYFCKWDLGGQWFGTCQQV